MAPALTERSRASGTAAASIRDRGKAAAEGSGHQCNAVRQSPKPAARIHGACQYARPQGRPSLSFANGQASVSCSKAVQQVQKRPAVVFLDEAWGRGWRPCVLLPLR
eukprot:scaffold18435_cov113-Isochrysis_galbana.AAC.15